ncbi:MAG: triose-phosphate isomerase [Acidimicrobiia bacterium]|nr:triose-phosphate isomerase [Acidimicrobiia bacterium]
MTGRKPIIAANWKMHHDHFAAIQFAQKFSYLLEKTDYDAVDIVICPPFTDLRSLQTTLEADEIPVALGAQNCHWEKDGAFTGEVSPSMLAKLNVRYVIVGHSERREVFGETDEIVNRKVRSVLNHGLIPIVCVGETLEEHEAGATVGKVKGQIAEAFAGVNPDDVVTCVVAYEPIWAIGTGHNATPDDAQETISVIRGAVSNAAGEDAAQAVRIQYGGSVKPGNISALMAMPDIDGALVGGASLDPEDLARIVRF